MSKTHKLMIFAGVIVIIVLSVVGIYKFTENAESIGTVSGAEYEYIIIDNKTYEIDFNNDYSQADKDEFLGIIRNNNVTFRIYAVKGDDEHNYIYRLWGHDGAFYHLKE